MALPAMWMSMRMQKSPSVDAFLLPVSLDDSVIIQTLIVVANEIISLSSDKKVPFHQKNFQSLIRTVEIFLMLFEYLCYSESHILPPTAYLCFKEVYLLLHESKILLDYCLESGRLWLLIQNAKISRHFHDINREILMILDVLPLEELQLREDVREHIELLKKQLARNKFSVDRENEAMRSQLLRFIEEFGDGKIPDSDEIEELLVVRMGIRNPKRCRKEIEFLEELMSKDEDDYEPPSSVLRGIVALVRYCRFLFFGSEPDKGLIDYCYGIEHVKPFVWHETLMTSITDPTEFLCPISLDVMQYPVVTSTGHTYDRTSISEWIEQNRFTCPKTRERLAHDLLIPNRALQSLISQWCLAYEIPYPSPGGKDPYARTLSLACSSTRAETEANRATGKQTTAKLLIRLLSDGSSDIKRGAVKALCSIVKTGKDNGAYIVEAGAVPRLQKLLSSLDQIAQEKAMTIIMHLSTQQANKSLVMEEKGCLSVIIGVLIFGHTLEARESAAFTLFCLCKIHQNKRIIGGKDGAIRALIRLLEEGTEKGQMIAVKTLHRLSSHEDNCIKLVKARAIKALGEALETEELIEVAAGALGFLAQQTIGAEAIRGDGVAMLVLRDSYAKGLQWKRKMLLRY